MKTRCLDITGLNGCAGVIVKDAHVVQAGATVYSMGIHEKREEYEYYKKECDIRFIFDDEVVTVDFYTVPRVDIMAVDSEGGWIGTVGGMCDLESDGEICYISRQKECFLIAENCREFLRGASQWKERLMPYDGIRIYASREEAEKEWEFLELTELMAETEGIVPDEPG